MAFRGLDTSGGGGGEGTGSGSRGNAPAGDVRDLEGMESAPPPPSCPSSGTRGERTVAAVTLATETRRLATGPRPAIYRPSGDPATTGHRAVRSLRKR